MARKPAFVLLLVIIGTVTSVFLYQAHTAPENAPVVFVKHSPVSPWIEVYHNGVPTSEWQPKDGEIYRFLVDLLEDDLYVPVPEEEIWDGTMVAAIF